MLVERPFFAVGDPAFGLGGVLAEARGDVACRVHPLTDVDAEELIASVTASRVLHGDRSAIPVLRDLLLRVSQLVEDVPAIVEMDIIGVLMACWCQVNYLTPTSVCAATLEAEGPGPRRLRARQRASP